MGFLRHLKIRTIGWAFVIALVVSGGAIVGASVLIARDIPLIRSASDEFEEGRPVKTRVVTALRAEMGTGGMIHHFKDFVLRRDAPRLKVVQERR